MWDTRECPKHVKGDRSGRLQPSGAAAGNMKGHPSVLKMMLITYIQATKPHPPSCETRSLQKTRITGLQTPHLEDKGNNTSAGTLGTEKKQCSIKPKIQSAH